MHRLEGTAVRGTLSAPAICTLQLNTHRRGERRLDPLLAWYPPVNIMTADVRVISGIFRGSSQPKVRGEVALMPRVPAQAYVQPLLQPYHSSRGDQMLKAKYRRLTQEAICLNFQQPGTYPNANCLFLWLSITRHASGPCCISLWSPCRTASVTGVVSLKLPWHEKIPLVLMQPNKTEKKYEKSKEREKQGGIKEEGPKGSGNSWGCSCWAIGPWDLNNACSINLSVPACHVLEQRAKIIATVHTYHQ